MTVVLSTSFLTEIGSTLSSFFGGGSYSKTDGQEKETETEEGGEEEGKPSEEETMEEGGANRDTTSTKEKDEPESVAEGKEMVSFVPKHLPYDL